MGAAVVERDGVTSVDNVDRTVSGKDGRRMLSKVQYYEVAKSIVADYVRLKSPLKRASHMDLTHIARLSFLIHDTDTALYALKCVLDRNEMPDIYDLNVLLGGIAQSNPRQASKMAHKALALGVRVDRISWTLIIHHALLLGDFKLAELIINKSNTENITWDYQSIDMIVRRGFNDKVADRDYATEFFHNSLRLLQRQAREGREAWTSLGIVTVNRALHWRMPVMAFEFWKLLCKPKLESATRLPSGLLPKNIGEKMPLQVRIAEALVFEYEQVGAKCGYTWAMGLAMCVEMDVPTLWTPTRIKNK
ncbi:hypothetical protein BS47DRAFT_1346227 [Hydnum rufescens UP504]|uniref:Pentatricopeptide repeat-containing protein n=1 Tax=Hydnum rufescens UP504 TaxID=1448309 RepID=A0A9P6DVL8_9AGAM|nr:hypothetical protein BS47DRAFT_1346227 [Hydnum rufescens UP504]